MCSATSKDILPEPPIELKRLSEELANRIREKIDRNGPIPFSAYMEMALYEPGLGYYSAGLRKFGADGDFVTAPELGDVFARCIAGQIEQVADALEDFSILEVGAGTGRLACDVLAALPAGSMPSRYMILERSADLRARQEAEIANRHPALVDRVEWLDEPPADPWQGVLLANEVIDALPVELFSLQSGQVKQQCVAHGENGFYWQSAPAPDYLETHVRHVLGDSLGHLTEDYTSEICLMLAPWLDGLTAGLERGYALFIDYGYSRRDYYSPQRHMGTLICNYRHRAHDDPFVYPGLQDISAFVDFTALAEAADSCGLECAGYTSQAMFLLGSGLEDAVQRLEPLDDRERMTLATEIRELTMPGAMGEKFQVMALGRDMDLALKGFEHLDLRYRL